MWPLTQKCSLRFAIFKWISVCTSPTPWICSNSQKQEILDTSQLAVQKSLHLFDLICSKIFFTHWSVQPHPFKYLFSSAIHPFKNYRQPWMGSKIFVILSTSSFWKIFVIFSSISHSISNGLAIHFSSIHLPCVHL